MWQVVYTYKQGIRWCIQIAEGLQRLHNGSPMIIHRDLKLDNVLLAGEHAGPPLRTMLMEDQSLCHVRDKSFPPHQAPRRSILSP